MKTYRAAVIGCSRMGGFIDNEITDYPGLVRPYSHAAGFSACPRVELVACADTRPDVMEQFGLQYNIPKERQYTDYQQMIANENLDIVSVATQPEQRAAIVIYAAEHGIKAIYAEKALASSLAEADAMVEAVERNNVFFNCGTNRRWSPNYDQMKAVVDSGEFGKLKNLIAYNCWAVFDTGGHVYDTLFRLNNDQPAEWVQGRLLDGNPPIEDHILRVDPKGEGTIGFANGVVAYSLSTPRNLEVEAICENGSITALNDALGWQVRKRTPPHPQGYTGLEDVPFTPVEPVSTTLRLIEDLVHSLDTGEAPRGGIRIARASLEIGFALIESQLRGGARVELPLQDRTLRMDRRREPRLPRYQPLPA